ncbi:pilin [Acinetobacter populi]|uniref:pilin n=1 Tax=Acinetobacter populi TaxID=1582270 RepID=UPI0023563B5C|nr:pilin [Acinetobacter populi]
MKRQQGFTLIEIIIAIAILGILAAIVTVNYTLYTKKTIVSVALSEISALKTEYEMAVNENYSDLGSLSNIDISASKYCTLEVNAPDSMTFIAEKALVFTLKNTVLFGENAQVYLSRNATGQYTCHAENIAQQYLPATCTSND